MAEGKKRRHAEKIENYFYHLKGERNGERSALTEMPPDSLTDDCWMHVFSYIPWIDDRVSISRVCRNWKELMSGNNTCFSQSLHVTPPLKSSLNDLEIILKESGRFLKNIDIQVADDVVMQLSLIARYCKRLEKLNLDLSLRSHTAVAQNGETLATLFTQCASLKEVYINCIPLAYPGEIFPRQFPWESLLALPSTLTSLNLEGLSRQIRLTVNLSHLQALTSLRLSRFTIGENDRPNLASLRILERLDIDSIECNDTTFLREINQLRNLRSLHIDGLIGSTLNDGIIAGILHNCSNIIELHLKGIHSNELTDNCFVDIKQATKLEELVLGDCQGITHNAVMKMSSLRALTIVSCSNMSHEGIVQLVEELPHLSRLWVSNPKGKDLEELIEDLVITKKKNLHYIIF